ncbi:HEPN domain-containing protein [Candidatus Woesearchaeota archaeon]|nr:HEPN domain-containing protein [Candidatus Woesearchaeota archaeon]
MKKPSFLNKLFKEGRIKETEPSQDVSKAYLEKSAKSHSSAKALLDIRNLEDSVAMAYYSMYHCLLSLLFRIGIKCENHAAAIIMLKKVFGLDNILISKAKTERIDKQYYIDFKVSESETQQAIESAEDFISEIKDFIDKLNNEKVKEYREKAIALLK